MWFPVCPPTNLCCSWLRPLPDVQECEARGPRSGGRGIDAYQRLLGQGPSSAQHPSHSTLPQEEEGWYRGPCGPFPALPMGCEGSWGGAGASWIGKGAAGQGPGRFPADLLQETGPLCEPANGSGVWGIRSALHLLPAQRGAGEGHPGSTGGWEGTQAFWAIASPALGSGTLS